jgi:hypothetical protein
MLRLADETVIALAAVDHHAASELAWRKFAALPELPARGGWRDFVALHLLGATREQKHGGQDHGG